MMENKKFLVIQTAFIGDAILATAMLEKLHQYFPTARIDYMVRKGNDGLFKSHPFINQLYVWDKQTGKYKSLWQILKSVRKKKYDYVINLQRFASTGLFTAFAGSKHKIGFSKNPFSFLFNSKVQHSVGNSMHEVERNQLLIEQLTDKYPSKPKLYPSENDYKKIEELNKGKFICISPASVWFTKQYPKEKWIEFVKQVPGEIKIFLLGAPADKLLCEEIVAGAQNKNMEILAGKLSLIESAALMHDAMMNYTNDSAPMHLASAMDAPTTAIFCSTIQEFGFGPLASNSTIIETQEKLACRPCGLHGKKACPEGHFKCGYSIDIKQLLKPLKK